MTEFSLDSLITLFVLSASLLTGLVIFMIREESNTLRTLFNLAGTITALVLVGVMLWGVYNEHVYEFRLAMLPGTDFALRADALGMLFLTLSVVLWFLTTIYAVGYLEGSPSKSRFFGFFSLCISATTGLSLSANLFTFFIFYELLTLAAYPLVVHKGTVEAVKAGGKYLKYTLGGGAVLLAGVVWLHVIAGPVEFATGGSLAHVAAGQSTALIVIFAMLIAGVGVKAAIFPLHGWLPVAMVAPAPVSALLHAVAVVKAGAFGIVRVVYSVYGIELASGLGVLSILSVAASVTIIYGSLRALSQDDLKKRLAYSTISQLSYIALGVSILGPVATVGGVVHLVHQGIMKITLFFCAGNLAETIGVHRVSNMGGVGRRMPLTMAAFTVSSLGMIGVPPMAGFISKWYLGTGAMGSGMYWVVGVLAASSLLNAAYFLPIIASAWFGAPSAEWKGHRRYDGGLAETSLMLLIPTLATALFTILAGLLAGASFSPLEWARMIAIREYR